MADGEGCTCSAMSKYECCCDTDWTTVEVYELRNELRRLEEEVKNCRQLLSIVATMMNVPKEMIWGLLPPCNLELLSGCGDE